MISRNVSTSAAPKLAIVRTFFDMLPLAQGWKSRRLKSNKLCYIL